MNATKQFKCRLNAATAMIADHMTERGRRFRFVARAHVGDCWCPRGRRRGGPAAHTANASAHCQTNGRTLRVTKTDETRPPYILGNYPRVEVQFACDK
jgi:hypothetical protein